MKKYPSVDRLKKVLDYNPDTGVFRWRSDLPVRAGRRMNGKIAGGKDGMGYLKITIDTVLYFSHRLAWLYVHDPLPDSQLDHIDSNKLNNAIKNLRPCTAAQNSARRRTYSRISPSRGIFPQGPGFVARIHHAGKRYYLGYFPTLEAAKLAYAAAAKEIHGDFAYQEPPMVVPIAIEPPDLMQGIGWPAEHTGAAAWQ